MNLQIVQSGTVIHLIGVVPSLQLRYLAEQVAAAVPGVGLVDLQQLALAETYIVQPGDTLISVARAGGDSGLRHGRPIFEAKPDNQPASEFDNILRRP